MEEPKPVKKMKESNSWKEHQIEIRAQACSLEKETSYWQSYGLLLNLT